MSIVADFWICSSDNLYATDEPIHVAVVGIDHLIGIVDFFHIAFGLL